MIRAPWPYAMLVLFTCGLPLVSQQYPPSPMPFVKDVFPTGMAAAQQDPAVLRAHGWSLFKLAWDDVSSGYRPRWYSWCTGAEMFDPQTPASCDETDVRPIDQEDRMQHMRLRFDGSHPPNLPALPVVVSDVYISPALAKYIYGLPASARPPIEASQRTYTQFAPALFDSLLKNNVAALPDGQTDEVAVKVSWAVVPCPSNPNSPAPWVPIVNGFPSDDTVPFHNFTPLYIDPQTLKRNGCKPDLMVKPPAGQPVARRNELFWFQKLSNDPLYTPPSLNPQQGDYMFVVAIHIITREQKNWVWATYWLSDDSDTDHMKDKPADVKAGKGAHFAMDISLGEDRPIYNPFIAADGSKLTCRIPPNNPATATASPQAAVKTNFLWTLARQAANFCGDSN